MSKKIGRPLKEPSKVLATPIAFRVTKQVAMSLFHASGGQAALMMRDMANKYCEAILRGDKEFTYAIPEFQPGLPFEGDIAVSKTLANV
jgi:hypothetical protein